MSIAMQTLSRLTVLFKQHLACFEWPAPTPPKSQCLTSECYRYGSRGDFCFGPTLKFRGGGQGEEGAGSWGWNAAPHQMLLKYYRQQYSKSCPARVNSIVHKLIFHPWVRQE